MRYKFLIAAILIAGGISSCKKESRYKYEVQEQVLYQSSAQKNTAKTPTQFISIAYNDLFNAAITTNELNTLSVDLQACGDKNMMEDLIIKNLLAKANQQIPDNNTMREDIPAFVTQTYVRFYNRQPTEFEAWKMQQLIQQNTDITPQMIYYAVMTSEEYKYY
ncbi:MAG TPA: hypothetical protein VG603_08990 [Chitinophagales bacterium]|nr:hypothetical protein [Chitinophagales bacterium]